MSNAPIHIDQLSFEMSHKASRDVVSLIKETRFGTKGSVRYRHQDSVKRINDLHQPDFLVLREDGKAVGTSAYCRREVQMGDQSYDTYYIRYFSVEQAKRSKGIGKQLMAHAEEHYRKLTAPTIFYAYIELANIRSMKVSSRYQVGAIGNFKTLFFSRFFPKNIPGATRISAEDKPEMMRLLKKQYADYALVNFQRVFFEDNYFVFKQYGEIVAGVQANLVKWVIEEIPGTMGKVTQYIVPHIPLLRRLFNPKDYQFVSYEAVYCKPGHEKHLAQLFESVLATFGVYTGMSWFDVKCALAERITKNADLGFLGKIQKSPPANVVAEYHNFSESEKATLEGKPIYISAFDLT